MVSALGASIFLQNALMLIYGARYQVYPDVLPQDTVSLFGVPVPVVRLAVVAVSVTMMAALYFFVQKTKIGTAIRAAAIDQGAARLMGIDVNRVIQLVFVIGPALGGAAGLLVGLYYGQICFTMGWTYGMKAFTAAILGGHRQHPRRHGGRPGPRAWSRRWAPATSPSPGRTRWPSWC